MHAAFTWSDNVLLFGFGLHRKGILCPSYYYIVLFGVLKLPLRGLLAVGLLSLKVLMNHLDIVYFITLKGCIVAF